MLTQMQREVEIGCMQSGHGRHQLAMCQPRQLALHSPQRKVGPTSMPNGGPRERLKRFAGASLNRKVVAGQSSFHSRPQLTTPSQTFVSPL